MFLISESVKSCFTSPKYDDAKSIYVDLFKRLDAMIITTINPGEGLMEMMILFTKEICLKWIKFLQL